jgi:hypothetical protein
MGGRFPLALVAPHHARKRLRHGEHGREDGDIVRRNMVHLHK